MSESETNSDRLGEATVRRFIDRAHDALFVRAGFGPMFAAYLDHVRRWENVPDGLTLTFMRQGLGAATLHLSCRPRGESVGWTINIHQPATNVFLTGDTVDRTVTGRIFTENVKPSEASRMYVQTTRADKAPVQSAVEVTGLDVLDIFEQYYRRSEQIPARFFEITDDEFLMILGLPDVDSSWVEALSREDALGLAEGELDLLGETKYRFECGCSSEKILGVVRSLFGKDPEDLFRGDEGVEIFCPRCGRRWWVNRTEFDGDQEAPEFESEGE